MSMPYNKMHLHSSVVCFILFFHFANYVIRNCERKKKHYFQFRKDSHLHFVFFCIHICVNKFSLFHRAIKKWIPIHWTVLLIIIIVIIINNSMTHTFIQIKIKKKEKYFLVHWPHTMHESLCDLAFVIHILTYISLFFLFFSPCAFTIHSLLFDSVENGLFIYLSFIQVKFRFHN